MRTIFTAIYVIFLLGATCCLHAQDKLVLRNGRTVEVKILRSSEEEDVVKYIYPSETRVYERPKSVISYILYEDGRKEVFNDGSKDGERITSFPTSTRQTPARPATATGNQMPVKKEISPDNVKSTFLDSDVKNMTRLKRISASSSISYKDALQQLKKQAAALGATHVLIMDVPEDDKTDEIEVIGVAFRDDSMEVAPPSNRQPTRQSAESSAGERRRRTARLTEDYNNNTKLILDDAPPRQQAQTATERTPPSRQQAQTATERTPPSRQQVQTATERTPPSRQQAQTATERTPPSSEREIFSGDEEDAVYLLNGRVIKGTIEEFEPDDFVSIRTSVGRIYEFNMDEVKRLTHGSASRSQRTATAAARQPAARDNSRYVDDRTRREERPGRDDFYPGAQDVRGYKGIFDIGYTLSFGHAEKGRFELSTSHGFQMNRNLFVGLGVGLHLFSARKPSMRENMGTDNYPQYANPEVGIELPSLETLYPTSYEHGIDSSFTFLPAFVEMRTYLPVANSIVSPFASIKLGYAFNLTDGFGPAGFYFAPSIGAKFDVSPTIGMFLNIGYTFQGLGESGTTERITGSGSSQTTIRIRQEGYGYYYRDQANGDLFKTTSAQGFSIRLGIEF